MEISAEIKTLPLAVETEITCEPSDEELARLVGLGHSKALEDLYDRYYRQAMSLAFRILGQTELAEEVAQETFLKFWQQPELYLPHRGRFATWLLSVVHHRAINERRRSSFRLNVSADLPQTDATRDEGEYNLIGQLRDENQLDLYEEVWQRVQREQIRLALKQLNLDQRRAIELAYFEGLNQREIAQKLGEPLGTIKTRIRLGLQRLRSILEAQELNQIQTQSQLGKPISF